MQFFKLAFFAAAASAAALEQLDDTWDVSNFRAEGSTTTFHIKGKDFETDCKLNKSTAHNLLPQVSHTKCDDAKVTFSMFPLHNEAQAWILSVGYNGVAEKAIAISAKNNQKLNLPESFKLSKNRP